MVYLHEIINDELFQGFFPQKHLRKCVEYSDAKNNDFAFGTEDVVRDLLSPLQEGDYFRFVEDGEKAEERNEDDEPEKDLWFLINTGRFRESFADTPFGIEAVETNPSVTQLDSILLGYLSSLIRSSKSVWEDKKSFVREQSIGFWANIVVLIQYREWSTRKTVNCNRVYGKDIFDVFFDDWNDESLYSDISQSEFIQLDKLIKKQIELRKLVSEEIKREEKCALETEKEWGRFVNTINRFASKERKTIDVLLNAVDSDEKVFAIKSYFDMYEKLHSSNWWEKTSIAVMKRYKEGRRFCCVKGEDNCTVLLNQSVLELMKYPRTYNTPFLRLHLFRILREKKEAERFFQSSIESVKRNYLGYCENEDTLSIEEACEAFFGCFDSVFNRKEILGGLAYSYIKKDTAVLALSTDRMMNQAFSEDLDDMFLSAVHEVLPQYKRGCNRTKKGKSILLENKGEIIKAYVKEIEKYIEARRNGIEDITFMAKRLMHSISLLHLFTDAVDYVLSDVDRYGIKHPMRIKKICESLKDIDDRIIHNIYGGMEGVVRRFRDENGINSENLVRRERNYRDDTDRIINSLFVEKLFKFFSCIIMKIDDCSEEEVQRIRMEVWEEIERYPIGIMKEDVEGYLEQINLLISDRLMRLYREKRDEFQLVREELFNRFGIMGKIIPETSMDALTTAELMYKKYATHIYEQQGFNYSSISSLYYQAFEAMYNSLIWKPYADKINNEVMIDGVPFTEAIRILWEKREELSREELQEYRRIEGKANQYLNVKTQKNIFAEVHKSNCHIKEYCTFCNFANMIHCSVLGKDKGVTGKEYLYPRFLSHLAETFGFIDKESMKKDSKFIEMLSDFEFSIRESSSNRNNASHGGIGISLEQCNKDQKSVLVELETERKTYLGLMVQLTNLFKWNMVIEAE